MHTEGEKKLVTKIKAGLPSPPKEELDRITAHWLFGKNAEKMMRYAPWSFVLTKLMGKKGEEPW